jgi:hypothetical protein
LTWLRPGLLTVRLALLRLALLWTLWPALLRPDVLPLGLTVLRLRTAGAWVLRVGRLILVGHKLPRWLRWPHPPDLQRLVDRWRRV